MHTGQLESQPINNGMVATSLLCVKRQFFHDFTVPILDYTRDFQGFGLGISSNPQAAHNCEGTVSMQLFATPCQVRFLQRSTVCSDFVKHLL